MNELENSKVDFFGVYIRIVFMKRYITKYIQEDLDKKIILLTGPRQNKGLERVYRFDIGRNCDEYSDLKGSA